MSSNHTTRRNFIAGAGTAVLATGLGSVSLASHESAGHGAHTHGHHETLVQTALDCVAKSEACIKHCIERLREGDRSMADCAAAVQQMNAVCSGLARLAAHDSPYLARYAAVCIDVCAACEAECREHETMHAVCKACADACSTCADACRKVSA